MNSFASNPLGSVPITSRYARLTNTPSEQTGAGGTLHRSSFAKTRSSMALPEIGATLLSKGFSARAGNALLPGVTRSKRARHDTALVIAIRFASGLHAYQHKCCTSIRRSGRGASYVQRQACPSRNHLL